MARANISLSDSVMAALGAEAEKQGRPRANLITHLLTEWSRGRSISAATPEDLAKMWHEARTKMDASLAPWDEQPEDMRARDIITAEGVIDQLQRGGS